MTERLLMLKATLLFPITPTTPETAVRHARRAWVRAILILQEIKR